MKAITTKWLAPSTRYPCGRVKASDLDGNQVVVVRNGAEVENIQKLHQRAAEALCTNMNWQGTLACGWIRSGLAAWVFVTPKVTIEV